MHYLKKSSLLVFIFSVVSFFTTQAVTVATTSTSIKKSSSIISKVIRPVLKTVRGITDDGRWILCILTVADFVLHKGSYDIQNSLLARLCLAAFIAHYASGALIDELPS